MDSEVFRAEVTQEDLVLGKITDFGAKATVEIIINDQISIKWLKSIVNIFGEDYSSMPNEVSPYRLVWIIDTIRYERNRTYLNLNIFFNTSYYEEDISYRTIATLFKLAITAHIPKTSIPDDIFQKVYTDLDELTAKYSEWVWSITDQKLDVKRTGCDYDLYKRRICCNHHMTIQAQRAVFVQQFYFLLDIANPPIQSSKNTHTLQEAMALWSRFAQPYTAPQLITNYFEFHECVRQSNWNNPRNSCENKLGIQALCCPMHITICSLEFNMHCQAFLFEEIHHISQMVGKSPYAGPMVLSHTWIELLIKLEGFNREDFNIPKEWDADLPGILSNYSL